MSSRQRSCGTPGAGAVKSHDEAAAPDAASCGPPESVTAVVLTYRRPRLAGGVVRSLLESEGFRPDRVVVVVNGEGGLDDPELEAAVRMVRLPVNTGPAGGFRVGLEVAAVLKSRAIPYIITSGYEVAGIAPGHREAFVLSKPYSIAALEAAIRGCVR